jgi:uncharacterized RDD family membrane protein YckC
MPMETGIRANPYAVPVAVADRRPTPDGDTLVLADRSRRLGAVLLDSMVTFGALIPLLAGAFMAVLSGQRGYIDFELNALSAGLVVLGALGCVSVLIFQTYRLATTGQTLGRKFAGIRIVKMDGSAVSFSSAVVLRTVIPSLIFAIPYLGLAFWLVDRLFIFRDDRRCIHDLIADTKVVIASSTKDPGTRPRRSG